MGLFWKHVRKAPPIHGGVQFRGDKEAVSKRLPLWWRMQHNRHSLSALGIDPKEGYYIFFSSGGVTMRYRLLLRTDFVLVRIGREPVTFWIEDKQGNVGELMQTNAMRIGIGRARRPAAEHALLFQLIGDQVSVV